MNKHKLVQDNPLRAWPFYGCLGLGMIAVSWSLNWAVHGYRTHLCFFPLWLGYCLVVDAWTKVRKGTSLASRSRKGYIVLFVISMMAWWLFEAINDRTRNWEYLGVQYFNAASYFLFSSLNFSTVMPAVFGTAELAGTFRWIQRFRKSIMLMPSPSTLKILFGASIVMFILTMTWPRYFFPFIWIALYCCLEPVNAWLGNRTLLDDLAHGDWRPMIALWTGVAVCGFFWEMWNYYSYPKWVYHLPYFNFLNIFEMPLPGYIGYLPFSMELFALFHFMKGLTGFKMSLELIPDSTEPEA
jgi:hypothetical protein